MMECEDFSAFQDLLRKMRDVDDKLVYALNCSIPTPSHRVDNDPSANCKKLYETVSTETFELIIDEDEKFKLPFTFCNFMSGAQSAAIRSVIALAGVFIFSSYYQLLQNYSTREKAIRNCIAVTSARVQELKKVKDTDPAASKALSKELTKLRLIKTELNVEEVVRDRSKKLYYERCRDFFKPPDLNVS